MKTLILALIFSSLAQAQDPGADRLSDQEVNRKLVSVARDIENSKILAGATQLQSCRDDFQRDAAKSNNPDDPQLVSKLETCLKGKITPADAATLSDKLDLETYKLIPSKTVQNITSYLTKSLYRELTGVDIEERDNKTKLQSMKFKTMKQVDQKIFFDLYRNQLAKNVLYEISRFCLNDFRNKKSSSTTFIDHWNNLDDFAQGKNPDQAYTLSDLTDDSSIKFETPPASGSAQPVAQDAQSGYAEIMRNVFNTSNIPDSPKLSGFFFFCGRMINKLCEQKEAKCPASSQTNRSCDPTIAGAKACLTKDRLIAYRNAINDTKKVADDFATNPGMDVTIALDKNQIVQRYSAKSVNELTNIASDNFYKATKNDNTQRAENCVKNGGNDCDDFSIVDDSAARIEANTNIAYSAKREAELARVRDLKTKGDQGLKDYLEKYYPDLKDKVGTQGFDPVEAISQRWDAKREAMMDEIKDRIGSRQITKGNANATNTSGGKTNKELTAQANARDVLNEKTRLAQVVFFNNIITSSLDLQAVGGKRLGQNVQAAENELTAAETEVQGGLFSNLRTKIGAPGSGQGSNPIAGAGDVSNLGFLDSFIGVPKNPNGQNGGPTPAGNAD